MSSRAQRKTKPRDDWASRVDVLRLRDLVERHDVRWEVWPHQHVALPGELLQVGFDLEIYGTHDNPEHDPWPGCHECAKVYAALRDIAVAIMPPQTRQSSYEMSDFDRSLHYADRADMRAEVRITVAILHKHVFGRVVDSCEVACLHDMESRLTLLGARKGSAKHRG